MRITDVRRERLIGFLEAPSEFQGVHPSNGVIVVPDRPGIGVDLDDAKVAERKLLSWE